MSESQLPYSRGLTVEDVDDLRSRFASAVGLMMAYTEGRNPWCDYIKLDYDLDIVLDTINRFDIKNNDHLDLMIAVTSYALRIERIDPSKVLHRSRKQFFEVGQTMLNHIADRGVERTKAA